MSAEVRGADRGRTNRALVEGGWLAEASGVLVEASGMLVDVSDMIIN